MFFHICIRSQACSFDTRKGAKIYMAGFYNFGISTEFCTFCLKSFHLCCLMVLKIFLPRRQSWPLNLVRDKTIVLFVSDYRTSLLVLVCDDWNYMSLLLNIVHVPSTDSILPLSSPRWPFFPWLLLLFPQLRSGLWNFDFWSSDQYEVLQTSSIVNNLSAQYFGRSLSRTKPRQYEAEESHAIFWLVQSF